MSRRSQHLERRVDEDLDERPGRWSSWIARRGRAVGGVGRDERADGDGAGVGEQPGDVRGAADVLGAVLGGEAEVAVDAVAQVVAVEAVGVDAVVDQARLELVGDRRLARRRAGRSSQTVAPWVDSASQRSRAVELRRLADDVLATIAGAWTGDAVAALVARGG